jgi:hypothetical protein
LLFQVFERAKIELHPPQSVGHVLSPHQRDLKEHGQYSALDAAGTFKQLVRQIHADGQLLLQPPPNALSVATLSVQRLGKRCCIIRSSKLLGDCENDTGLGLPDDNRSLQVIDVIAAFGGHDCG